MSMKTFAKFLIEAVEPMELNRFLIPRDVYEFYFLSTALNDIDTHDYFSAEHYLMELKGIYLYTFAEVLTKQIEKYFAQGRVDKQNQQTVFGADELRAVRAMPIGPEKFVKLQELMTQTQRSSSYIKKVGNPSLFFDPVHRNGAWEEIAKWAVQLAKSDTARNIAFNIDRINNSVHQTGTTVLEKIPDANAIIKAFDEVHKVKNPLLIRNIAYNAGAKMRSGILNIIRHYNPSTKSY